MPIQTQAQADAELQQWYAARIAAAKGKSFQITTSAGTRILTRYSLAEIDQEIQKLERKVAALANPNGCGLDFAVANFNNDADGRGR